MSRPYREMSSEQQLHELIRSQMRNGQRLDDVINSLRNNGWQDAQIQAAMAKLNKENKEAREKQEAKLHPLQSHSTAKRLLVFGIITVLVLYVVIRLSISYFSNQFEQSRPAPLTDDIKSASDLFDE